jgi:CubicO group peptidase (beta-lactamase class C family)
MRTLPSIAIIGAMLAAAPAHARQLDQAARLLDVWLAEQVQYRDIPSLSVGLVRGQEVVYLRSFGHANLASAAPATPDTLYRIASLSKLFTSIAVMQLRDAGKLSLQDPVDRHLPWFSVRGSVPGSDPISIESILSHSSGLPREASGHEFDWMRSGKPDWPNGTQLKDARGLTVLFPVWARSSYSNLGMMVAGEVVAGVSGVGYHSYMRKSVLDPMGLHNTFSEAPMPTEKHGRQLAAGYGIRMGSAGRRPEVPYHSTGAWAAAGGFVSSAKDLSEFIRWQLRLLDGQADAVLSPGTLREMQRQHGMAEDAATAFGLGFEIRKEGDRTLIGHNGGIAGYQSHVRIDPQKRFGGVALMNTTGSDLRAAHVVACMLEVLESVLDAPPEGGLARVDEAARELDAFEGTYYGNPWDDEGTHVLRWGNGLASFSLRARSPMRELTRFERQAADRFVASGSGDGDPQVLTFMRDGNAKVIAYRSEQTISRRSGTK